MTHFTLSSFAAWLKSRVTCRNATLALLAAVIAAAWPDRTPRPSVEIVYCVNGMPKPGGTCRETVTLKIPAIYYATSNLDYSQHLANEDQHLEVAYPSMQPWHSVPWLDRLKMHKVEIDIFNISSFRPEKLFSIIPADRPDFVHPPVPLYGLDNHFSTRWHTQLLLPIEPHPRVHIRCAYRAEDDPMLGCTNSTLAPLNFIQDARLVSDMPIGLNVRYSHKRVLLPDWRDLHFKVRALVRSFVVPT